MTKMYNLPFDIMELENLKNMDEIVVDLSVTNFPKDINNISTVFIYLRNIGLNNLKLDFSNCSYEVKSDYIKEYINSKFEVKQKELSDTLLKVICTYYGGIETNNLSCILNPNEIKRFIDENKKEVLNITTFLVSLPLYQISRLELQDDTVLDTSDIEYTNDFVMGENLYSFLEFSKEIVSDVLSINPKCIPPKFYSKYFIKDNERLLYILKDSMSNVLLFCIATKNNDLFDKLYELNNTLEGDADGSK